MRHGVLLATCGLASGCALAISTSDYAGGPLPSDGGAASTSADATTTPGDAGSSPTNDGAAAHGFCASLSPAPRFCADFDEGPLDLTPYTQEREDQQVSTFVLDGTNTRSPPSALLVGLTKSSDGDEFPPAWLRHKIGAVHAIHAEADILVERTDTSTQNTRLFGVQLGGDDTQGAGTTIMFGIVADGHCLVDEEWDPSNGGPQHAPHGVVAFPTSAWMHVVISADATTKSLSVTANGTECSDGAPIQGPIVDGESSGVLGLYYPEVDAQGWSVSYDNVVVDGQ